MMAKGNKFSEDTAADPNVDTATENTAAGAEASGEAKEIKSIVPSKYAAKYKDPKNDDPLRSFIKEQCGSPIDLVKFYALLRANGIGDEHIKKFEAITTDLPEGTKPAGGVAGRAVMTLRNRLTPIARSDKGIVGLDGKTYDVKLPPAPKTGAVAKAAEAKEAANQAAEENAA
jgi:hypothetical protein